MEEAAFKNRIHAADQPQANVASGRIVQAFEISTLAMLQPIIKPTRTKVLKLLEEAELLP